MKSIGVFLSSKRDVPEAYHRAAREVGAWIGARGYRLVYGGSRCGLMEELAQAVKAAGGRVCAVVPQIVIERNLESELPDITFPTADLNDRKAALIRESDLLLALPGGIGTLDEAFTALAASTIGLPSKPLVFYDAGGCWQPLFAALREMQRNGLIDAPSAALLRCVSSTEALDALL